MLGLSSPLNRKIHFVIWKRIWISSSTNQNSDEVLFKNKNSFTVEPCYKKLPQDRWYKFVISKFCYIRVAKQLIRKQISALGRIKYFYCNKTVIPVFFIKRFHDIRNGGQHIPEYFLKCWKYRAPYVTLDFWYYISGRERCGKQWWHRDFLWGIEGVKCISDGANIFLKIA